MAAHPRLICRSAELTDGAVLACAGSADSRAGEAPVAKGVRFEHAGGGAAFAVRFRGRAYGYVNCCPHAGSELDWLPGEFFDETGIYLICATHGALFEPETGRCVAGPCKGQRLAALALEERDGHVYLQSKDAA